MSPELPEPDLDDPDNPEWTEADFARAKAGVDVLPEEVIAAFPRTTPKRPIRCVKALAERNGQGR